MTYRGLSEELVVHSPFVFYDVLCSPTGSEGDITGSVRAVTGGHAAEMNRFYDTEMYFQRVS